MKHTPGTWIERDGQIYPEETGKTLALIPYFDKENEEEQANARLIAAAPTMYKIIQAIRARINGEFDSEFLKDFICSPSIEDDVLLLTDRII